MNLMNKKLTAKVYLSFSYWALLQCFLRRCRSQVGQHSIT